MPSASALLTVKVSTPRFSDYVPSYQEPIAVPSSPDRIVKVPFITSRRISTRRVVRLFHRVIPMLKRMERLIRPRWRTPFETTKRIVGVVVLLLAATLVWPFPFSHIIPAVVIMLVSFAYLEEDGVLLMLGVIASLASVLITAATVWLTFIVGTAMAARLPLET